MAAHIHMAAKEKSGNVVVPLCGPCTSGAKGTATLTPVTAYPGFRAFPYPGYSEVFFGDDDYRVLRGGAWITDPVVARPTFRNWDYPQRRQIFSGIRCARDA